MYRIVIAEDQPADRLALLGLLEQYQKERQTDFELFVFESGGELLLHCPPHPDLFLLDIEMAPPNGMETAHRIRQTDKEAEIIFVTQMVQYALEGYEVEAADFVVKPVSWPSLSVKLDRVLSRIAARRPRLFSFAVGKETRMISSQSILYFEALNKKTLLHQEKEVLEITEPLRSLEERLRQEPFFRCHNAFLINLAYVQGYSAADVRLPGAQIPLSKYRRKEFLAALAAYHGAFL